MQWIQRIILLCYAQLLCVCVCVHAHVYVSALASFYSSEYMEGMTSCELLQSPEGLRGICFGYTAPLLASGLKCF